MEIWHTFVELVLLLGRLVIEILQLGARHGLVLFVLAWCVFAINWRKMWPTLAAGAWMPLALLLVVSALVWASILPSECHCLPLVVVPNFWWQLGAVGLMAAIVLFCGWVQGYFGWHPPEISVEPAGGHGAHGHGHDHGHDHHGPDSHVQTETHDAAHATAHDSHGHH